ncbi:YraN family protein [Devosia sp. D6-9]|nr:YraN family protein [Devosia sp. D6-9]
MPPSLSRQRAERAGRRAEALAAWFLRLKLYSIRARRFRTPVGEIDLVASRFGVTVFVEVKSRGGNAHELEAFEAVDQRRIARAAEYYLVRNPGLADSPLRFDVIFLAPRSWPRHVVNAFQVY